MLAGEGAAAPTSADAAVSAIARHGIEDDRAFLAVATAKIRGGQAAGAAIAHQVHGAMGFTREYGLQHRTRRLWTWCDEFDPETVWAIFPHIAHQPRHDNPGGDTLNREFQIELGRRFHRLHEGGTFLMPNAWDTGSALLLETVGFEALGTTSAGIAYSLGKPDATGALAIDEALDETARIAGAVSVPVNMDAENGYSESPDAVAECIRQCIEAGAVGAGIEDYTQDPARPLYDRALAVERIRAAREAADASGVPFVLTARAECYLYRVPGAFAESVARSNLYREAGADCLYTPGVRDRGEVAALVREIDGPMNFVVGKGMADYTLSELGELGIRRVSIGGSLMRATFALAERVAAEMKREGRFDWAADQLDAADFDRLFASRRGR